MGAASETIGLECPHCGERVEVYMAQVGEWVECPGCKLRLDSGKAAKEAAVGQKVAKRLAEMRERDEARRRKETPGVPRSEKGRYWGLRLASGLFWVCGVLVGLFGLPAAVGIAIRLDAPPFFSLISAFGCWVGGTFTCFAAADVATGLRRRFLDSEKSVRLLRRLARDGNSSEAK